jgi:hypothetical protein
MPTWAEVAAGHHRLLEGPAVENLRTIEEVCEQQEGNVYVIAALPEWEHS